MRVRPLRMGAFALLLPALAWAEEQALAIYFPVEVGRTWTYALKLQAGGQEKTIEYTTRVERTEPIEGVGPCAVLVSRSADRLLKSTWYGVSEGRLLNPRQQGGKPNDPIVDYTDRVLLTEEALQDFKGDEPAASRPTWSWTCSDGSSGSITLDRRERLYLPKIGDLKDCVVLVERGTYPTGSGEAQTLLRTTERTAWLAPRLGLVKEVFTVLQPDGAVSFSSEATLTRFQGP